MEITEAAAPERLFKNGSKRNRNSDIEGNQSKASQPVKVPAVGEEGAFESRAGDKLPGIFARDQWVS
jgi:hypothetical protein